MKEFINSRLPTYIQKNKKCPYCGETDFNMKRYTFLYFSFNRNKEMIGISESNDEYSNVYCSACGGQI